MTVPSCDYRGSEGWSGAVSNRRRLKSPAVVFAVALIIPGSKDRMYGELGETMRAEGTG
jgi:hypothetical protein